jgi:hypothetical protein
MSPLQCWGSVTFWCGSGSEPLTNKSGSNSFLQRLTGCKKNFCLFFLLRHIIFSLNSTALKINFVSINFISQALFQFAQHLYEKREGSGAVPLTNGSGPGRPKNSRNQGFSYYFCLMTERSGAGSIPMINGSGSGSSRPKNTLFRLIRIRITNIAKTCGSC